MTDGKKGSTRECLLENGIYLERKSLRYRGETRSLVRDKYRKNKQRDDVDTESSLEMFFTGEESAMSIRGS